MKKVIGLSVVFWADDGFIESIKSVIDFVDEMIIGHNELPYSTSILNHDPIRHEKIKSMVDFMISSIDGGNKIKYIVNKKPYTSVGITDLINNDLLFEKYDQDDMIMYVDSDEIFIPSQLSKIKNIVLSGNFDQFKIYQRHYIKYDNLGMPCPTNPNQTFITKNIKKPSYIRNHKDIKTFIFPEDRLYYKHMAYCPKNGDDLKTKLIGQSGCEGGITIDMKGYDDVFMKITNDNYGEFKNFSYIKEFPHHMPFINKE